MVQDEELFRAQADPIGIFSRGQVGGCIQAFALAGGENETRARRPRVNEPAIGPLENSLGCPAVVDPGEKSPGVQVLGDPEGQDTGGQGALHKRGFDPLTAPGDFPGTQRGADSYGGRIGGAQAWKARCREEGSLARRSLLGLERNLVVG